MPGNQGRVNVVEETIELHATKKLLTFRSGNVAPWLVAPVKKEGLKIKFVCPPFNRRLLIEEILNVCVLTNKVSKRGGPAISPVPPVRPRLLVNVNVLFVAPFRLEVTLP